jgi:uroporphyrinogen-III synthase
MSTAAPLTGRRIVLTRSAEDCGEWARRLQSAGAEPVLLPCIRCEPIDTPETRAGLTAALAAADWLVLTSRRGVEAVASLAGPTALPQGCRVAAVGAATAEAARARLGRVDVVGEGTAAALAARLLTSGRVTAGASVAIAVAENAPPTLERALADAGLRTTRCNVYRTVPVPEARQKRALSTLGADNILLASPSAVSGLVHQVVIDAPVAIYTIGPSTTAAARASGLAVTAEARTPSLEGLLEAMQWRN